jgi:hypothetical protein
VAISIERARAAKERILALLPKTLSVQGVGITQVGDDYAVKLNLAEASPPGVSLPAAVEGVPVVVEVVGRISKRNP